ncbi:hypothetical protein V7S43_004297 [Phytophthora oleae]|uniref:Uncharacterized protein n=1 Tax=Phytophthora oleae TaxID=2107226 RepID=A0ABD3FW04_9STRA
MRFTSCEANPSKPFSIQMRVLKLPVTSHWLGQFPLGSLVVPPELSTSTVFEPTTEHEAVQTASTWMMASSRSHWVDAHQSLQSERQLQYLTAVVTPAQLIGFILCWQHFLRLCFLLDYASALMLGSARHRDLVWMLVGLLQS